MADDSPSINVEDLSLDEVVAMDVGDLTDTHKEYLEDNKTYLTDAQSAKFGFGEEADEPGDDDKPDEDEPDEDKPEEDEPDDNEELDPEDVKIGTKRKVVATEEEEADDDLDPEDQKRISKLVAKGTEKVIQRQQDLEDRQSVDALITATPELKKYRAVALKYMKNPSYSNIPADKIMAMLSFDDQQKIGARKERVAAKKAKDTQSGGSTHRASSGGAKDWARASLKDVEAQIARAKGQRI